MTKSQKRELTMIIIGAVLLAAALPLLISSPEFLDGANF